MSDFLASKITKAVITGIILFILLEDLGYLWWVERNPGAMYTGAFLSGPSPIASWQGDPTTRVPNGYRPGGGPG